MLAKEPMAKHTRKRPKAATNHGLTEVAAQLLDNAFDFLERAIAEFEAAPKYAVIHFCAAVELFLKARLAQEHWTLVVAQPDSVDLAKFAEGRFVSVSLRVAAERLAKVLGVGLAKEELQSFEALVHERNRMVHFHHPLVDGEDAEVRARLAAEQCLAWHHMHAILVNRWEQAFPLPRRRLREIETAMLRHRRFVTARYKAIAAELKEKKAAGASIVDCPACACEALEVTEEATPFVDSRCHVCKLIKTGALIPCPQCERANVMTDGWGQCDGCGKKIEPDDVLRSLRAVDSDRRDPHEPQPTIANCGVCGTYHSAVPVKDYWVCSNCLDRAETVEQCEWCSDYSTYLDGNSFLVGCECCEGRMGDARDE